MTSNLPDQDYERRKKITMKDSRLSHLSISNCVKQKSFVPIMCDVCLWTLNKIKIRNTDTDDPNYGTEP